MALKSEALQPDEGVAGVQTMTDPAVSYPIKTPEKECQTYSLAKQMCKNSSATTTTTTTSTSTSTSTSTATATATAIATVTATATITTSTKNIHTTRGFRAFAFRAGSARVLLRGFRAHRRIQLSCQWTIPLHPTLLQCKSAQGFPYLAACLWREA